MIRQGASFLFSSSQTNPFHLPFPFTKPQELANLIASSPAALDTLGEIATQLATDESAVAALAAWMWSYRLRVRDKPEATDAAERSIEALTAAGVAVT